MKSVLEFSVPVLGIFTITLLLFISPPIQSVSFGFPGFSWGWGTTGHATENYTRVITSPEVVERYPLIYPVKQCSSGMEGIMTRLVVYPCVGENGRCHLTRGENVTLDLEFISNIPVDSLVGSLSAIFTRWFTPLTLGDPEDLCKSDQISCPIQAFYPYRYRTTIFVRPTLPALSPDIKVIIKTATGRSIACAVVPVSIIGLERDGLSDILDEHAQPSAIFVHRVATTSTVQQKTKAQQ